MSLNRIFEPPGINKITLPNRIVFPACQTNYATSDGLVTERLLRMYGKIAKGGSGLVIVGGMAVSCPQKPEL
jgi:2,4-dienoyl-CoA reductase-like NADH-dependent reductase (Old Yellow Enzyme family)